MRSTWLSLTLVFISVPASAQTWSVLQQISGPVLPIPRNNDPGASFSITERQAHFQMQSPITTGMAVVANGGDIDGDGVNDVLIGNPYDDEAGANAGRLVVVSGATGCVLEEGPTPSGSPNHHHFGESVAGVGDLDGDGYGEFAVGGPRHLLTSSDVRIYNGAPNGPFNNWMFFRERSAANPGSCNGGTGDHFATSMVAHDIDNDGTKDLIVGSPYPGVTSSSGQSGRVTLYDLSDIRSTPCPLPAPHPVGNIFPSTADGNQDFGMSVDWIADVNGDGFDDIVAGAPWPSSGGNHGFVEIHSGQKVYQNDQTSLILRINVPPDAQQIQGHATRFGQTVRGLGDIDGNGLPEIGIAAPSEDYPGGEGVVRVMSIHENGGVYSATTLYKYEGATTIMANPGDVYPFGNPDGVPDFFIGRTHIRLHSGAGGNEIMPYSSSISGEPWISSSAMLGDINNDGYQDFVVGGPQSIGVLGFGDLAPSFVTIQSGIDASAGGQLQFKLDAGKFFKFHNYTILGTTAGTTPGQQVTIAPPSRHVPLNPSAYFDQTLANPNTPPLSGAVGPLDNKGRSIAHFTISAGTSLTAPVCYHHAFVTTNPSGSISTGVSNATVINVIP